MKPREHEIQKAIADVLRLAGATVLETTAYRQKGPSGTDKGVPDLLVFHPATALPIALCLEVKAPGGRLSLEQKVLRERGFIRIVESPEEALKELSLFVTFTAQMMQERVSALKKIEFVQMALGRGKM